MITLSKQQAEKLFLSKPQKEVKHSKYGNKKTTNQEGRTFDSITEARFDDHLNAKRHAQRDSDRVCDIQYQVHYPLTVNGQKVCAYIADFVVQYGGDNGETREAIYDVKGYRTDIYKLKKKLFEACTGKKIIEVEWDYKAKRWIY